MKSKPSPLIFLFAFATACAGAAPEPAITPPPAATAPEVTPPAPGAASAAAQAAPPPTSPPPAPSAEADAGEPPPAAIARRIARLSRYKRKEAGFSPEQERFIKDNCPMGMPKVDATYNLGPTEYVARQGYVLQHSSLDKIPLWVCEHLTLEEIRGSLARADKFAPDPLLKGPRAELADYKGSGLDRGHMAPAGDQASDARLKEETFFLSNMAPQAPRLNQDAWRELEDTVRTWAESRGGAWVITGPMFYDPAEEDPETADGFIEYSQIGKGAVGVPTHFYKIVVAKTPSGALQTIAFVMENHAYKKPYDFLAVVRSIDWIEERTGLDFMPALDPAQEKTLERRAATALWQ